MSTDIIQDLPSVKEPEFYEIDISDEKPKNNRSEDRGMDENIMSDAGVLDDGEIVRRFFERDESALSAVSGKYGGYCMRIARNILGNDQSAEECVNDTLMRLWETIPPDRPSSFPAFVGRIVRNISLNVVRSSNAQKRGGGEIDAVLDEMEELVSSGDSVERTAEQHELMAAVNDFLGTLTEKKRMVFVLRYWHCESVSEVAACVGMSQANVSNVLKRERKKLMEYLSERGLR